MLTTSCARLVLSTCSSAAPFAPRPSTSDLRAPVGLSSKPPYAALFVRNSRHGSARLKVVRVCAGRNGGGHHPIWGPYEYDEYPSPDFIEYCKEAFPEEGVATLEEARTLFSEDIGYVLLDVRSKYECELTGSVVSSVNIPLINVAKSWGEEGMVLDQDKNPEFLAQVQQRFPDKSHGILIMCSDGSNRAIQTLVLLEENGYTNIVGVRYGYNGWLRKFTPKLERRRGDDYKEEYRAQGDSQGLHVVGKAYNVDALDPIRIKDDTEWIEYSGGSSAVVSV